MFLKLKFPRHLNNLKSKLIYFIKSKFTREKIVKTIFVFLIFCLLLLIFKFFAPFFMLYFKQLYRVLYGGEVAECGGMCSKGGDSPSFMEKKHSPGSTPEEGQASSTKRLQQAKIERSDDFSADKANATNFVARNVTAGGIAGAAYVGNELKKGNVPNVANTGKAALLGIATYNTTDALKDEAFREIDKIFPTKSRKEYTPNNDEDSNQ